VEVAFFIDMETAAGPQSGAYPVQLDLTGPLEVQRWRVVGNLILAIPHLIIAWALESILEALTVVAFIMILFTGNIPSGLFNFMAMILRYTWRVTAYLLFMRESYPEFDYTPSALDPGTDPATFSIPYPERLSRGLIFIKWLLVIPNILILSFVALAAAIELIIAWFGVLITGKCPEGTGRFDRDDPLGHARQGIPLSHDRRVPALHHAAAATKAQPESLASGF
jgi:hypothetical protein